MISIATDLTGDGNGHRRFWACTTWGLQTEASIRETDEDVVKSIWFKGKERKGDARRSDNGQSFTVLGAQPHIMRHFKFSHRVIAVLAAVVYNCWMGGSTSQVFVTAIICIQHSG